MIQPMLGNMIILWSVSWLMHHFIFLLSHYSCLSPKTVIMCLNIIHKKEQVVQFVKVTCE